jgi:hypothetical protein
VNDAAGGAPPAGEARTVPLERAVEAATIAPA